MGGGNASGTETNTSTTKSKTKLKKISSHTPMEILSGAFVVAAVGTSVPAMILTKFTTIVWVSGLFSIVLWGYAYYQQTKLTDIIALKETHEAVTREVDRLQSENMRLNETVGKLSGTIDGLEDTEEALDVITQTQGQSVETFAEQVKENRDILNQFQKNLRTNILQNLLQVVIRSDQDDNMQIEEDEIDDLINRIKKINGVEVREERFKEAIRRSKGSLSAMDIIKNLMAEDSGEDEVFTLRT